MADQETGSRGLGGDLGASGGILAVLFDPDLPRAPTPPWQVHSATSQDSAFRVGHKANPLRERVFQAILEHPRTDEELAYDLEMNPSTLRPRRVELVKDGRVREAGTRPTRSGRQASVWEAV